MSNPYGAGWAMTPTTMEERIEQAVANGRLGAADDHIGPHKRESCIACWGPLDEYGYCYSCRPRCECGELLLDWGDGPCILGESCPR